MTGKAIAIPGLSLAMHRRGLSQSALAKLSGVPTQTISRVIRDGRASPPVYQALAKAIEGVKVLKVAEELLGPAPDIQYGRFGREVAS